MIDYCFFLSYPRIDRTADPKKDLIKQFYDDLRAKVIKLGHQEGGFFDTVGIEPGEEWTPELEKGLSWSRILVPLYSPNYLNGKYCPKEWQVFYERHLEYTRALPLGVDSATVILPVNWIPEKLPDPVSKFQAGGGKYPDVYNTEGLEYMMTRPKKFKGQYQDFLDTFARDLVKLARQQGGARARVIPLLKDVFPAFAKGFAPGPEHVRFIFIAGTKFEMKMQPNSKMPRNSLDSYGELDDRKDWRPCFPDVDRQAGDIATDTALNEKRQFQFLRPNLPLIDQVKEAELMNNTVIVVVDPWSVRMQTFQQFVTDFDRGDYPNCGVVVTWPPKDVETNASMEALRKEVQNTFRRRITSTKTYYRDEVNSAEDLSKALVEAFYKIRSELVDRGKVAPIANGPSPGRPIVTT